MRVISSGVQASSGVRSPEARISSSSRSHSGARSWMVGGAGGEVAGGLDDPLLAGVARLRVRAGRPPPSACAR